MEKKFTKFIMLAAFLFCSTTVFAQHTPKYVEPGNDGPLPEILGPEKTEVSYLPMLFMRSIWSSYSTSYGSESFASLEFNSPSYIGAEKYIVQYLVDGNWVNDRSGGTSETVVPDYASGISPKIYNETAYRLYIVGGPNDGKVSNEVEVKLPITTTVYQSLTYDPGNYVGYEEEAPIVRDVKIRDQEIKDPTPYLRYNWYRRNPYTYEMTKIEGANSSKYTYTVDDIGYEVIGETCGDGEVLDFCTRLRPSLIGVPLFFYPEYAAYDGVILNTNYVLPSAESLYLSCRQYNETTYQYDDVEIPATSKTEVIPGQYKICADLSKLDPWTMIEIKVKANDLVFPFVQYDGGGGWIMTREAQIQLYEDKCRFTAMYQRKVKNNITIDVKRPNIDGIMQTAASAVLNGDTAVVSVLPGKYYLYAHPTEETAETYYPAATTLRDAEMVNVPTMDENWNYYVFVIQLQPKGSDVKTLPGDANEDGVVDVADITAIASYILGTTPGKFNAKNADANADGTIDVADITKTADIILNGPANPSDLAVDLGLESGIKWAAYNVGATKPEEFGDFYAWGEVEPKSSYTWENYLYFKDGKGTIGEEISGTQYDVAHVKWGGDWRLPTKDELFELIYHCLWETTESNGVKGYLVKSKTNSNSIFLPAAGKNFDGLEGQNESGTYRSGSGNENGYAYVLNGMEYGAQVMHDAAPAGFSVRPVCK